MRQYVPEEQLWTEFNGALGFDYDHSTYWPALTALCAERREARREKWVAGGSQVGEYEDYLTGHVETGVNKTEPSAAEEPKAADEVTLVAEAAPQGTTTADEALAAKTGDLAISENAPVATDAEETTVVPVVASA